MGNPDERFSHFDVEKSDDGITFYKATSVQGKEVLNGIAKYIVDIWHKQYAYYRIKAYDYVGQERYSNIVFFEYVGEEFQIYPIPSTTKQASY